MSVEKHTELTPIQKAMLEVVQASRESADQRAHCDAQLDMQRDEALIEWATYKGLAQAEAGYLGEAMLGLDRKRFIPFAGKAALEVHRVPKGRQRVGGSISLPKVDIVIPLAYPTEQDHFDEVPIVTGWRVTAHTLGSDIRQFFAAFRTADNLERERQVTGLTLEQVVQNPDNAIESVVSSDYYGVASTYGRQAEPTEHPDVEPDGPYYFEQFSILRALHQTLR